MPMEATDPFLPGGRVPIRALRENHLDFWPILHIFPMFTVYFWFPPLSAISTSTPRQTLVPEPELMRNRQ